MVELQEALHQDPLPQGQGWDNPTVLKQDLSLGIKTMPQGVDNTQDTAPSPSDHVPNIQTSLAVVKRRKLMDSGDIHLMGRRVTDAGGKDRGWSWSLVGTDQPQRRQRGLTKVSTLTEPQPHHAALTFIIFLILDVPGEPKVTQLHTLRGGHQDVPDSNVPARRESLGWGGGMEQGRRRDREGMEEGWRRDGRGIEKG